MSPPLCTQRPGERCPCPSRSEQLPPAGSTGQLARAVTTATGAGGPGGWHAPGRPPAAPPLGWVPGGPGMGSYKVTQRSPLPGRQVRGCRSYAGPSIPKSGVLCPSSRTRTGACSGAPVVLLFFCVLFLFFFSSKFVGAGLCTLPRRALPAEGARSPVFPGRRPQPPSYLDVRHLRPRSLTPARAWRRHSPFALAGPARWHGQPARHQWAAGWPQT